MDDGVQGVLGWGQFTIEGGVSEDGVSGLVTMAAHSIGHYDDGATTTTFKKKSHDHRHQIFLGGDVKFRMAFKPLLGTLLIGL